MRSDIYNISRKFEIAEQKIKNSKITEKNKKLILKFQKHCILINMSQLRTLQYMVNLREIALAIKKDFDKATTKDIKSFVQELQQSDYSVLTRNGYKAMLKRFYKWLKGKDMKYPKEVEWINTTIKRSERKLPGEGDLLTEQEIKKLIDAAEHPRDKAFISVLYESGCRIGEMCSLRIKDVKFDEHGVLISITGKTGPRTIRLISSVAFISSWLNIHPLRKDRDVAVWISIRRNHGKPLRYPGVYGLLEKIFKKTDVSKKCNPHLFRHSRATYLANHLTEFQMNQYLN